MASLFGKTENEKQLFITIRKLNFNKHFNWPLAKKLKIVITFDSNIKTVCFKTPGFYKKTSMEFNNSCLIQ